MSPRLPGDLSAGAFPHDLPVALGRAPGIAHRSSAAPWRCLSHPVVRSAALFRLSLRSASSCRPLLVFIHRPATVAGPTQEERTAFEPGSLCTLPRGLRRQRPPVVDADNPERIRRTGLRYGRESQEDEENAEG